MPRNYSPWPWRFGQGEDEGYILAADGLIVAGGEPHEGRVYEDDDDDVLMCTAPELLEVLKDMIREMGPDLMGAPTYGTAIKARALIQRLDK